VAPVGDMILGRTEAATAA